MGAAFVKKFGNWLYGFLKAGLILFVLNLALFTSEACAGGNAFKEDA